MSLALSEVKSEEAYAPIVLVEDEAFSTPPNQFYQVLKGPSREEYRARTWKKHLDQGNKSHWLVVTDSNTRQPLGAAHWLVHETDPFEHSKPRPALDATWWPEGSERRDISTQMLLEFYSERAKFMNRPHVVLENCFVSPSHQRRGVGRLLVQWGCDLADSLSLPCFVESSEAGKRLYESVGFVAFERVCLDPKNPKNPKTDAPTEKWLEVKHELFPNPMIVWRMSRPVH